MIAWYKNRSYVALKKKKKKKKEGSPFTICGTTLWQTTCNACRMRRRITRKGADDRIGAPLGVVSVRVNHVCVNHKIIDYLCYKQAYPVKKSGLAVDSITIKLVMLIAVVSDTLHWVCQTRCTECWDILSAGDTPRQEVIWECIFFLSLQSLFFFQNAVMKDWNFWNWNLPLKSGTLSKFPGFPGFPTPTPMSNVYGVSDFPSFQTPTHLGRLSLK